MELASAKIHKTGAHSYDVTYGEERGLFAEFEVVAIEQEFESKKQGRPIFQDVEFVRIHFPGDRTKQVYRPVKLEGDDRGPADPDRFPAQWKAFKNKQVQVQTGTPVEQWPPLTKSRVAEFKSQNVHTVEQIAGLTDMTGPNMGLDWRKLRDLANAYLDGAKGHEQFTTMQQTLEDAQAQIAALTAQVRELGAIKTDDAEPSKPSPRFQKAR